MRHETETVSIGNFFENWIRRRKNKIMCYLIIDITAREIFILKGNQSRKRDLKREEKPNESERECSITVVGSLMFFLI